MSKTLEQSPDSPKKGANEILDDEVDEGLDALHRGGGALLLSAISAGLDVGFSVLVMGVLWTQTHEHLSEPIVNMLVAVSYAVGFIFVIVGRSELFTEQTTLAVLPVLHGRASLSQLLRLWIIVFVGNMIGALVFGAVLSFMGPRLGIIDVKAFSHLAEKLVDHGWLEMLVSAVLAGWLMGLLSWLVAAGRDTISQIALITLVTSVIGIATLNHVVVGAVEVFAGFLRSDAITGGDFARFLIYTTIGNAIGGSLFVAVIKYGHAK